MNTLQKESWEEEFDEKFLIKGYLVVGNKRIKGAPDNFMFTPNRIKSFIKQTRTQAVEEARREILEQLLTYSETAIANHGFNIQWFKAHIREFSRENSITLSDNSPLE